MPLTSVELAETWVHANSQRSPRCNVGGGAKSAASGKVGSSVLAPSNSPLEKILRDVHKARDSTYLILDKAIQKGDSIPIAAAAKNHSEAISAAMRTEEWVTETLKERGELVTVDAARMLINRTLAPIQAALDGLPTALGQRCNPSAPLMAETAIREAVDGVKVQIQAAIFGAPPPPPPA